MMRSALRALANGLSDLWLDPGLREDILGGRPGASKRKKGKRGGEMEGRNGGKGEKKEERRE